MSPLSKKLSLFSFLLLAFSFLLLAPSPSLATSCATMNDCASQVDEKLCNCPQDLINSRCVNSSNEPIGVCSQPIPCESDTDGKCSQGDVCEFIPALSSTQKYCVNEELVRAGKTPTYAPWYIETPEKFVEGLPDCENNNSFRCTQSLMYSSIVSSLSVALGGGESNVLGAKTQSNSGATGILTGLVLNMTTKPVISSREYLADLGQNLGIVPISPAYAQGIGFASFLPVLPLWKVFRDIAYLAFVAIFVLVGIMVMFRRKIDPRTVVTIQEALPKIVVSLLLVTFSYAIAGLIVDISQLATRLIGNTLYINSQIAYVGDSESDKAQGKAILDELFSDNIFKLVNPLRNVDDLVKGIGEVPIDKSLPVPGWLAQITVRVIFWFAGFFIMFKIFFALLSPFVSIMLSVIFAPLQLLLGAIPGNNDALQGWLKGLIANVAVFPITFAMLAIAAILHDGVLSRTCPSPPYGWTYGPSSRWCPPEHTYETLLNIPVIGNWGVVAGQLISFGILFTIPKVAEMVQSALQMKPQPWGKAYGEEIAAGAGRVPIVGGLLGGFMK